LAAIVDTRAETPDLQIVENVKANPFDWCIYNRTALQANAYHQDIG
jgi:hypothetical protein